MIWRCENNFDIGPIASQAFVLAPRCALATSECIPATFVSRNNRTILPTPNSERVSISELPPSTNEIIYKHIQIFQPESLVNEYQFDCGKFRYHSNFCLCLSKAYTNKDIVSYSGKVLFASSLRKFLFTASVPHGCRKDIEASLTVAIEEWDI